MGSVEPQWQLKVHSNDPRDVAAKAAQAQATAISPQQEEQFTIGGQTFLPAVGVNLVSTHLSTAPLPKANTSLQRATPPSESDAVPASPRSLFCPSLCAAQLGG